jgi:hypothetical protein
VSVSGSARLHKNNGIGIIRVLAFEIMIVCHGEKMYNNGDQELTPWLTCRASTAACTAGRHLGEGRERLVS